MVRKLMVVHGTRAAVSLAPWKSLVDMKKKELANGRCSLPRHRHIPPWLLRLGVSLERQHPTVVYVRSALGGEDTGIRWGECDVPL